MLTTIIETDAETIKKKVLGSNLESAQETYEVIGEVNIKKLTHGVKKVSLNKVENFINKGLDVNAVNADTDETLLMFSARTGNLKLCKLLHRKHADVERKNSLGENAFIVACKHA